MRRRALNRRPRRARPTRVVDEPADVDVADVGRLAPARVQRELAQSALRGYRRCRRDRGLIDVDERFQSGGELQRRARAPERGGRGFLVGVDQQLRAMNGTDDADEHVVVAGRICLHRDEHVYLAVRELGDFARRLVDEEHAALLHERLFQVRRVCVRSRRRASRRRTRSAPSPGTMTISMSRSLSRQAVASNALRRTMGPSATPMRKPRRALSLSTSGWSAESPRSSATPRCTTRLMGSWRSSFPNATAGALRRRKTRRPARPKKLSHCRFAPSGTKTSTDVARSGDPVLRRGLARREREERAGNRCRSAETRQMSNEAPHGLLTLPLYPLEYVGNNSPNRARSTCVTPSKAPSSR